MSEGEQPQTPLGEIVASRKYFRPGDEGEFIAEVAIGRPVPSPTSADEFICPFRIVIKNQELIRLARGIDEMHALLMALAYVDGALRVLKQSLQDGICYVGGDPGDLGLQIPDIAGTYGME